MRLTRKQFHTYLEEHQDNTFQTGTPWFCPIAEAIKSLEPRATEVCVWGDGIEWHVGKGTQPHGVPTTNWQGSFIRAVDEKGIHQGRRVTGKQALEVLDGVAA